jgi:predicted secreted protein
MERNTSKALLLIPLALAFTSCSFAETRTAQDMAKECRVALDLFQGRVEKTLENTLFAGECIGYVQGALDVSLAMADNVKWLRVCVPDSVSTMTLIEKFIAFVDKNPKYTLASTAFQLMLGQEFPCKK